ncbi:MAG: ribonuclease P protein component [bacterium]|nr:ribonuclease P protein component [bacterium]
MLPKRQRLTSSEVRHLLREGKKVSSHPFSLCVSSKSDKKGYAVVISSKIAGSKVKRNSIRRLVYEIIGSVMGSLSQKEVVVFVLSDVSLIPQMEIQKKIVDLFVKAKIMIPPK